MCTDYHWVRVKVIAVPCGQLAEWVEAYVIEHKQAFEWFATTTLKATWNPIETVFLL